MADKRLRELERDCSSDEGNYIARMKALSEMKKKENSLKRKLAKIEKMAKEFGVSVEDLIGEE